MKANRSNRGGRADADVVVIGAGGAGLAAAATAATNGAKVLVIEKRRIPGGATVYAEGVVAAESPTQQRANISCTRDELFRVHMRHNHWTLNARLVRELIDTSADTVRWLEERGLAFNIVTLRGGDGNPLRGPRLPAFHCPDGYGSAIVKALHRECKESQTEILYSTQAKALLIDSAGAVTGVAVAADGESWDIKAKSVIIATGGYSGSKELMKKYCPAYDVRNFERLMLKSSHAGDRFRWIQDFHTGEGIEMAFDIGAADEGLGVLLLNGPNLAAGQHAWMLGMQPSNIWINKDGKRFMDESVGNPFMVDHAVLRQPDQMMFTVFDHAFKQEIVVNGFPYSGGLYKHIAARIDDDLQKAVAQDTVKISNSWDEIAAWMRVDAAVLKNTITQHNAACGNGYDPLFAKDPQAMVPLRTPPFYAGKCYPAFLVTIGGIKVNHRLEVLSRKTGRPIKGLYAAGICTGGWSGPTYNISLLGAGCGFPIFAGRIAGKNASTHYLSQKPVGTQVDNSKA